MEIFSEEVTDQTEQLADIPDLVKKKQNKTLCFCCCFAYINRKISLLYPMSGPNYTVWGPREVYLFLFPTDSFSCIQHLQQLSHLSYPHEALLPLTPFKQPPEA